MSLSLSLSPFFPQFSLVAPVCRCCFEISSLLLLSLSLLSYYTLFSFEKKKWEENVFLILSCLVVFFSLCLVDGSRVHGFPIRHLLTLPSLGLIQNGLLTFHSGRLRLYGSYKVK